MAIFRAAKTILAMFAVASVAMAQEASTPSTWLGARVDCLHDFNRDRGASQDCMSVSGLRFGIRHQASPTVVGTLRLDPFATPVGGRSDTPLRAGLPGPEDTELGVIDAYAITWSPRPNLEIAAESYDGAARMPSVSGLALANSLALTGWKQSAMTVTYILPALQDMRVKFAVGNGEGEIGGNRDPQQYFGFEAGATVVKGVRVMLGASLDGNSVGSAEADFLDARYQDACGIAPASDVKLGHSTQRLAAGVLLDGTLSGVEGLKAGLGWQRNVMSDLDKQRASVPSIETLKGVASCRIDPDSFFVEASGGAAVNTVQQTTYDVSVAYSFLASYFVAADYTTRRIDAGSVAAFHLCDAYSGNACSPSSVSAEGQNTLGQDAITVGVGMDLAVDLRLTLEYQESRFDDQYAQVFYPAPDGKTSDTSELFNVRVAYNWR